MDDNIDIVTKTIEMRGIFRKEFVDYFKDLSEHVHNDKIFYGVGWVVEIGDEIPYTFGSITLMDVDITFSASQECLETLITGFRLKFMRAGG